jgi:two-component system OmpR family sensor kinase
LVRLVAEAVDAATTVGPDWIVRLEAARPVEATGDPARLRQVIDNLLSNVRTHTAPGTIATVRLSSDEGWATISVEDDGPGLPEGEGPRLFERFYRADESRAHLSGAGSGLGLSIVGAIVAAHGGTVDARGRDGGGSVFTIRIPQHQPTT